MFPFYTLRQVSVALGCVFVYVSETERVIYGQAAGGSRRVLWCAATALVCALRLPPSLLLLKRSV